MRRAAFKSLFVADCYRADGRKANRIRGFSAMSAPCAGTHRSGAAMMRPPKSHDWAPRPFPDPP